MMKRLACALAFVGAGAAANPPAMPTSPAPPPKLVIVISVDQLSAALFEEYRPHFTGGLARLAGGTLFANGYQSHAATETCPGHSTILTGARPARSGIIANSWIDQDAPRADKTVYCAEDERVPGSTSTNYTVSARHLLVPTLGDLMRKTSPLSRTVAVAGKDRAAAMMGGVAPTQRWFWRRGGFVTDLAGTKPPVTVGVLNKAVGDMIAKPTAALDPPALCAAKARPFEIGKGKIVGNGAFARAANDVSAFEDSPEYDGAVLALAAGISEEMKLGRGPATDLLAIGLSATDYVGHTFGTEGQEMCLQLLSLDRDLGDYFAMLNSKGVDYAVALTADHGSLDIPERVAGGQWVDPALDAGIIGKEIGAKLGLPGAILLGGIAGGIVIDKNLAGEARGRVRDAAIAAYRAHPQVEAIFTRDQIMAVPSPTSPPNDWSLIERVRASYNPVRSEDLYVVLKPNVAPYPRALGIASTHGSPWDYDRRVPIIFYRAGYPGHQSQRAIETVDIMPTLAASVGVSFDPGTIDGKCLDDVAGTVCPQR